MTKQIVNNFVVEQTKKLKELGNILNLAEMPGVTIIKLDELMVMRLREYRYRKALEDIQEIVDSNPMQYPDVALILSAALQNDGLGGEPDELETKNL